MAHLYAIGRTRFRVDHGVITDGDGRDTELRSKTAAVLEYLASRADRVVPREEVLEAIWPGVYVTENSLSQCIAEVRRALGPDKESLRTLPGRGYVLTATALEPNLDLAPSRSAVPMLAVLPFAVSTSDAQLGSFADIFLDCIVGALCSRRELMVISANSTRKFNAATDTGSTFGRRFGAQYIVTGRLHRIAECMSLSLELAEAASDSLLWQHQVDLNDTLLFRVPHELAATIASTLMPHIKASELREARRRLHTASAYQLVLNAQSLMYRLEPDEFQIAKGLLEKAIVLDQGFALAYAVLGEWYSLWLGQRWSQDTSGDTKSLERTLRLALELDPKNSRALAMMGHNRTILFRDYDTSLDLLARALECGPNDAETCMWASPTLGYVGRSEEAVRCAQRAIQLSPADPLMFRYQHFLSIAYYCRGDFEEAAVCGLRSFRSNSDYTSNLRMTTAALSALGRTEEAKPLVDRGMRLQPGFRANQSKAPFADRSMLEQYKQHLVVGGIPP